MMSKKDRIEEIKTKGYDLDFATVFNIAFENYKKIALYAGSMILVFMVLLFALIAGILISIYGIPSFLAMLKPENLKAENLSETKSLIFIASNIVFTSLTSPFFAGLIKMARCAKTDEEFHVSTVFEFYKAPYFKELFGATFLISIASVFSSLALNNSGNELISAFISIVITIFTLLTIPLIIFSDMKAIAAIKSSCIIVSKHPILILGLMLMAFLGSIVGLIGCFIGIFFTIPFMYSMYYAIYESIIGFE